MKIVKIGATIVAILMLIGLSGCSNNKTASETAENVCEAFKISDIETIKSLSNEAFALTRIAKLEKHWKSKSVEWIKEGNDKMSKLDCNAKNAKIRTLANSLYFSFYNDLNNESSITFLLINKKGKWLLNGIETNINIKTTK